MDLIKFKDKLQSYKKEDISFTKHAEIQAFVREIPLNQIKEDITTPTKLVYAKQQKAQNSGEEKYDCYFAYSKHLYHRYALIINGKVLIVTVIKINRDWQKVIG